MNPQPIPFIPDDAPFNPDQRAWLNGFLAGMFSTATQTAAQPSATSEEVALYFATQKAARRSGLRRSLPRISRLTVIVLSLLRWQKQTWHPSPANAAP